MILMGDGLEEIGGWAFCKCTSLVRIDVPPAIRAIKKEAFYDGDDGDSDENDGDGDDDY